MNTSINLKKTKTELELRDHIEAILAITESSGDFKQILTHCKEVAVCSGFSNISEHVLNICYLAGSASDADIQKIYSICNDLLYVPHMLDKQEPLIR